MKAILTSYSKPKMVTDVNIEIAGLQFLIALTGKVSQTQIVDSIKNITQTKLLPTGAEWFKNRTVSLLIVLAPPKFTPISYRQTHSQNGNPKVRNRWYL